MITFNEDHLSDEFAYIVENDLILHAVQKQVSAKPSVNVIYNSKVQNLELSTDSYKSSTVVLEDGTKYKAKLLVSVFHPIQPQLLLQIYISTDPLSPLQK